MALDERAFFTEQDRAAQRPLHLPALPADQRLPAAVGAAHQEGSAAGPPTSAIAAKFAKLRDHLIRVDDEVTCKTCGKRFEIPSMHSLVFVDQLEGLPKVDDEDDEAGADGQYTPGTIRHRTGAGTPGTARPATAERLRSSQGMAMTR